MTSESPQPPITVSQESPVPLSGEQHQLYLPSQHGDHLLPNIISQLSFIDHGPPTTQICMPDDTPQPVSDIPAVHVALPACVAVGPNAAASPIPAPSQIDEKFLAIDHILVSWAA